MSYSDLLKRVKACYESKYSVKELENFLTESHTLLARSQGCLEDRVALLLLQAELYLRLALLTIEEQDAASAFNYYRKSGIACSNAYSYLQEAEEKGQSVNKNQLKESNTWGIDDPMEAMVRIKEWADPLLTPLLETSQGKPHIYHS